MKLEEGMYVRTKNNGVCKIYREFHEESVDVGIGVFPEIDGFFIDKEEINYIEKDDILKSSKNIIDLIEVGDYVNGYLVRFVYRPNGDETFRIEIEKDGLKGHIISNSNNIKSIVTKEQFESMAYEVKE